MLCASGDINACHAELYTPIWDVFYLPTVCSELAVIRPQRTFILCCVCCLQSSNQAKVVCRLCDNSSRGIERVAMPYVFKYLAAELAAMNIKISVEIK